MDGAGECRCQQLSQEEAQGVRLLPPELTNPPGHLWRDKWTALSGPLPPPGPPLPTHQLRPACSDATTTSSTSFGINKIYM